MSMSEKEIKDLKLSILSDLAYEGKKLTDEGAPKIPDEWELIIADSYFFSGFDGAVFYNHEENTIAVAAAGTDLGEDIVADMKENLLIAFSGLSTQASDARELRDKALDILKSRGITDARIVYTGHSQGGLAAQHLADEDRAAEGVMFQSPGLWGILSDTPPGMFAGYLYGTHIDPNFGSNMTFVDPEFDGPLSAPIHSVGMRPPNSTIIKAKGARGHSIDAINNVYYGEPSLQTDQPLRMHQKKRFGRDIHGETPIGEQTEHPHSDTNTDPSPASASNAIQWLKRALSAPGDPEDEALLKDDLTEDEARTVMMSKPYNNDRDPRFHAVNKRMEGWFEDRWGTDNIRRDAAGRMIDAEAPKHPAPERPMAASVARTGHDLGREIGKVVDAVFGRAAPQSAALANADGEVRRGRHLASRVRGNVDRGGPSPILSLQQALNADAVRHARASGA